MLTPETGPIQATIIGAGSPLFATPIIGDFMRETAFSGSELVLCDSDAERLEDITRASQMLAQELGVDVRVRAVSGIAAAVTDADIVYNLALAGGKATAREEHRMIAEATGITKPVEAHAPFRQLRLMLDIAESVAQHSQSGVTLIQAANPIPEGATLVHRETGVNVIALCQGYREFDRILKRLHLDPAKVETVIAGINHNVWLVEFRYNGQDAIPILDDWVQNRSADFYRRTTGKLGIHDFQLSPLAARMYRDFGSWPVGDTVRASTPELWWYTATDGDLEKWFGPNKGRDSNNGGSVSDAARQNVLEQLHQAARGQLSSVASVFPEGRSGQLVTLAHAIAHNQPGKFQVNVPNRGAIADLPNDFVVEIPAVVDGSGVHRPATIVLPPPVLINSVLPRMLQAERHVRAMQTGDDRYLIAQYLNNHHVPDRETAERILEIRKRHDPQMAAHYSKGGRI